MIERFLKIGALIGAAAVALLLVASLSTTSGTAQAGSPPTATPTVTPTATATPDAQVSTSASVTAGTGVAPVIECKWELPDMQVGHSDSTLPDGRIQYGTATDAHVHDDDMAVVPDADNNPANGIQVPCDDPPATAPSMPQGVRHMIQVVPVPEDQPEQRHIQVWMAVDHPNGISNIGGVYWDIWHPNGDLKIELVNVPGQPDVVHQVAATDCNTTGPLGNSSAVGKMFESAVHTGQVSISAVDSGMGLLAQCKQGTKAIYYSSFDLSKEQPCGEYKIDATAVNLSGLPTTLTNYIDIECVYYLRIDFSTVNWGGVTPGHEGIVGGDTDFTTANHPTVKNVGNDGMGLGLRFSAMTGSTPGSKSIIQFDAKFGKSADVLQVIPLMYAGTEYDFDSTIDRVLCSNEVGKLDLSIEPPAVLPAGTYTGTLDVIGRHVASICENE